MKLRNIPLFPLGIVIWLLGYPTKILPQIIVNLVLFALVIIDILRLILILQVANCGKRKGEG
jgi:hypothetical protein